MKTALRIGAFVLAAELLAAVVPSAARATEPNVTIPPIPKCYPFTSDEDELVQQLENLRKDVLLNFPLGVSPGDPEYQQAKSQQDANISAIDAAIKQAKSTPLCPIKKAGAANGAGTTPQESGGGKTGGGGGAGGVAPNVTIPKVPECFPFTVDRDELLQQLEDLRKQVLLNFPLGASPGEAEYEQAKAQQDANLAAIDAAIKQAKDTPLCIVKKHKRAKSGKKTKRTSHRKHALSEDNPLYMENYQGQSTGTHHTSSPGDTSGPPPLPPGEEPQTQPNDNPYQHGVDIPNQPSTPPN